MAAGSGERMKSKVPKQFIEVNGVPILSHTYNRIKKIDNTFKTYWGYIHPTSCISMRKSFVDKIFKIYLLIVLTFFTKNLL